MTALEDIENMLTTLEESDDPLEEKLVDIRNHLNALENELHQHTVHIGAIRDVFLSFASNVETMLNEKDIHTFRMEREEFLVNLGVIDCSMKELRVNHQQLDKAVGAFAKLAGGMVIPNVKLAIAKAVERIVYLQAKNGYPNPVDVSSRVFPTEVFNTSIFSETFDSSYASKGPTTSQ